MIDNLKDYCSNKRATIFYLRGDEISFDLKADLSKYNFNCEEYVVYKQKRPIQQRELDNVLARKHLEGIALFSENSVDSLTKGASENKLNKIFFCFSKKIENRLEITFYYEPDVESRKIKFNGFGKWKNFKLNAI